MVQKRILVVEDDASMGFFLSEAMSKEGYGVDVVTSGEEALERIGQDQFNLVILDLKLPSMDGMEVLANMKVTNPELVVIMITAHGSRDIAMEAIRKGAYDYFTKPFDINEMRVVVRRALERGYLQDEIRQLRETVEKRKGFYNIVGNTKAMRDVFDMAETVFDNDINDQSCTFRNEIVKPFFIISVFFIDIVLDADYFSDVRVHFAFSL